MLKLNPFIVASILLKVIERTSRIQEETVSYNILRRPKLRNAHPVYEVILYTV